MMTQRDASGRGHVRKAGDRALILFAAAALGLGTLMGPAAAREGFERGINLLRPFNLPALDERGEPRDPPFTHPHARISDAELNRLTVVGFDHVRLPIAPGVFIDAPPKRRTRLDADLERFVGRLGEAGLNVVLDPHPMPGPRRWAPDRILAVPGGERYRAYREFLGHLARFAARRPRGTTMLGLMNEPQRECRRRDGPDWTEIQRDLHAVARTNAPDVPLLLTVGCWASIDALPYLRMEGYDADTLVEIHFYEPYAFTHQSPRWAPAPFRYIAGLAYPAREGGIARTMRLSERWQEELRRLGETGRPDRGRLRREVARYHLRERAGRAAVDSRFDEIARWAEKNGIAPSRIYLGEFGAWRLQPPLEGINDADRVRWLRDVREAAEARGFGWAHWEYTSPFGIIADDEMRTLDSSTIKALGLGPVDNGRTARGPGE